MNVAKLSTDSEALADRWPLVYDFDLKPGQVALIAGAYKGAVMKLLGELYGCAVLGYEPQLWAAERAEALLQPTSLRWFLRPYAIGDRNGVFPMGEFHTDACSFVRLGEEWREHGEGTMREAGDALDDEGLTSIALAVLNMEGYEYTLLPHLKKIGWLDRIDRMALQFHTGLGNDGNHGDIQSMLWRTHRLVKRVGSSWEYWIR